MSLEEELKKQFAEELGENDPPEHKLNHKLSGTVRAFDKSCVGCQAQENVNQLRQKYGLMEPQLFEGVMTRMDGSLVLINERRGTAKSYTR